MAFTYSPVAALKPPAPIAPNAGYFMLNPTGAFKPAGAAPSAASAIPGQVTVGGSTGYTPDYSSLIQGDAGLQQALAALGTGAADQASRDAAFKSAVIDYGQLPDLQKAAASLGLSADQLTSILGPDVGKLASENTSAGTSILARLGAINTKAVQGVRNQLAARGLYNSGELGYQLGQQQQAYTNSQYDSLKALLGGLGQTQQSYLQSEQQREMAIAQAASEAANRAYSNYQSSPSTPGITLNWLYTDANGHQVYGDGAGGTYNPDGSPYSGAGYAPRLPGRTQYAPGVVGPTIGAFK